MRPRRWERSRAALPRAAPHAHFHPYPLGYGLLPHPLPLRAAAFRLGDAGELRETYALPTAFRIFLEGEV